MSEGLEIFAPQPRVAAIDGEQVEVRPVRLREIPAFEAAVTPLVAPLTEGDLHGALARNPDAVARVIAIGTGRSADWAADLYPDAAIALLGLVVEANLDFFTRRLMPEVRRAAGRIAGQLTAARPGPEPLPGSSSADTGSTTPLT